jgi:DNA-binding IclR family transcriptional regulator
MILEYDHRMPQSDERVAQDISAKMVERIAAMLRLLAVGDDGGSSLQTIAEALHLKKPTAHRILTALVDNGLVFQDIATRNYRLGYGAIALGRAGLMQDVAGSSRASLLRLAQESGDTAFASIAEGAAAICIAREVGAFPIRTLTLSVGDRRPLGVGAGALALLAALPDAAVERTLKRNEVWLRDFQGFDAEALRDLVTLTRKRGYAENAGRIVPGMNAVAVAVLDAEGAPLAALSLAAIHHRMTADRLPHLVKLLREEALAVAALLEHRAASMESLSL